MISFPAILAMRDKSTLVVYARRERAVRGLQSFVEFAKEHGVPCRVLMASLIVQFPEGGKVTFRHADYESFQGIQVDEYYVEEAVKLRLDGGPLLTLLATRKR